MIDRRNVLLGSVSAVVLAAAPTLIAPTLIRNELQDELTQDELRLLAMAAEPMTASMEEYNRDHTFAPESDEKKTCDSLEDRGFLASRLNENPNVDCDYILTPTEKGRAALREAAPA